VTTFFNERFRCAILSIDCGLECLLKLGLPIWNFRIAFTTLEGEGMSVAKKKIVLEALDQLDVGICIVDAGGEVTLINRYAAVILGFHVDKIDDLSTRLDYANQISFTGKVTIENSGLVFPAGEGSKATGSQSHVVETSKGRAVEISQNPLNSGGHISRYTAFELEPDSGASYENQKPRTWGLENGSIFLESSSLALYYENFPRPEHDTSAFIEEQEPYFNEGVRLSAFEFGELESYGDRYTPLLMKGFSPQTEEDKEFLECIAGLQPPKTLREKIFTKLLYQALAMGGLHYDGSEGEFRYDEVKCANDIGSISSFSLKMILHSAAEIAEFHSEDLTSDPDDIEEEGRDPEDLEYEALERDARDEMNEELGEYMERGGNSGNDGWYYEDD
jgi:hypothetical protein